MGCGEVGSVGPLVGTEGEKRGGRERFPRGRTAQKKQLLGVGGYRWRFVY